MHFVDPLTFATFPTSHGLQTSLVLAPTIALAVPNGQLLHNAMESAAMAELNVPFLHGVHASFSVVCPVNTP